MTMVSIHTPITLVAALATAASLGLATGCGPSHSAPPAKPSSAAAPVVTTLEEQRDAIALLTPNDWGPNYANITEGQFDEQQQTLGMPVQYRPDINETLFVTVNPTPRIPEAGTRDLESNDVDVAPPKVGAVIVGCLAYVTVYAVSGRYPVSRVGRLALGLATLVGPYGAWWTVRITRSGHHTQFVPVARRGVYPPTAWPGQALFQGNALIALGGDARQAVAGDGEAIEAALAAADPKHPMTSCPSASR